jgi:hypothetical protein
MSGTPEYYAWYDMMRRCYKPERADYKYYGGRGVSVCERWHFFKNFYSDMGKSNGLTLDRIDVNGNYEPSNCKWSTMSEQVKNRRPWVQDECKKGHPYSLNSRGYKCCKECNKEAVRRYQERKKA